MSRSLILLAFSISSDTSVSDLDVLCFRYAADNLFLYDLSLEGAEPPADPMDLNFSDLSIFDDPQRRVKSYVLRAYLRDLIDYADKVPNFRVLPRNVRSDLKSLINRTIRTLMRQRPMSSGTVTMGSQSYAKRR